VRGGAGEWGAERADCEIAQFVPSAPVIRVERGRKIHVKTSDVKERELGVGE